MDEQLKDNVEEGLLENLELLLDLELMEEETEWELFENLEPVSESIPPEENDEEKAP